MKWTNGAIRGLMLVCLACGTVGAAGVVLQTKYPAGERLYELSTTTSQTVEHSGTEQSTQVTTTSVIRRTVSRRDAEGDLHVRYTYEAVKGQAKGPGFEVQFDSSRPEATRVTSPQIQPVADVWKALRGATYTLVLDARDQLKAIEGRDAIPTAARAALSEEALRRRFTQERGMLPGREVRKGDRWSRQESRTIGPGSTLSMTTYYEYLGSEEKDGRTLDRISVFRTDPRLEVVRDPDAHGQLKSGDLRFEATSGTLYVDREAGQVIRMESSTRVVGPVKLDFMGTERPGRLDLTFSESIVPRRP